MLFLLIFFGLSSLPLYCSDLKKSPVDPLAFQVSAKEVPEEQRSIPLIQEIYFDDEQHLYLIPETLNNQDQSNWYMQIEQSMQASSNPEEKKDNPNDPSCLFLKSALVNITDLLSSVLQLSKKTAIILENISKQTNSINAHLLALKKQASPPSEPPQRQISPAPAPRLTISKPKTPVEIEPPKKKKKITKEHVTISERTWTNDYYNKIYFALQKEHFRTAHTILDNFIRYAKKQKPDNLTYWLARADIHRAIIYKEQKLFTQARSSHEEALKYNIDRLKTVCTKLLRDIEAAEARKKQEARKPKKLTGKRKRKNSMITKETWKLYRTRAIMACSQKRFKKSHETLNEFSALVESNKTEEDKGLVLARINFQRAKNYFEQKKFSKARNYLKKVKRKANACQNLRRSYQALNQGLATTSVSRHSKSIATQSWQTVYNETRKEKNYEHAIEKIYSYFENQPEGTATRLQALRWGAFLSLKANEPQRANEWFGQIDPSKLPRGTHTSYASLKRQLDLYAKRNTIPEAAEQPPATHALVYYH